MIPKSIMALLRRAGHLPRQTSSAVIGSCVALSVPVLAYLMGSIIRCLVAQHRPNTPPLSPLLPPAESILGPSMAPLAQISEILGLSILVVLLTAGLLFIFYRHNQYAAVAFEVNLIKELRAHAKRLAVQRTLSAQQTALTDCLDYHLPRVRASLSRWWRAFPRHLVQLVACVLVALLIAPTLTLLTLLATTLTVLVYRYFDLSRRKNLPVVRERASQERGALVQLGLKGPLLESVHNGEDVENRFADQLMRYQNDAVQSLSSSAWKIPVLLLVGGLLTCLFTFVVAVKTLAADGGFSVASVFPFCLCLAGAAFSALRLERGWRELSMVQPAADELNRFLSLTVESSDDAGLKSITSIQQQVVLEHVTVKDSSGRKLLEDISVTFEPGRLIGVVSNQSIEAHALVELLMGFGRPESGRMLFDGELASNLKPHSLIHCAHWVASDGAIVTGTVMENLVGDQPRPPTDLLDSVVANTRLTEVVQQLPDESMTLITPSDDRLSVDGAFRIGIARAALRKPSIIVIEEPCVRATPAIEQGSLDSIRSLVSDQSITVVLPQRLITLRACDTVIMLHDHHVLDSGTHAELLQRNELYRHLNYLRFNPYRGN